MSIKMVVVVDDFTKEQGMLLQYGVDCLVRMIAGGGDPSFEVMSTPHVPLKTAKAKFPSVIWEDVPDGEMVKAIK
jgi:hypothetical protein